MSRICAAVSPPVKRSTYTRRIASNCFSSTSSSAGNSAADAAIARIGMSLIRIDSALRFPRVIVLVLDAAAAARLEAGQHSPDIALIHAENERLLFPLLVGVPEGDEVLPGLAEQQNRRHQDGSRISPADVLPVFDGVDAAVA